MIKLNALTFSTWKVLLSYIHNFCKFTNRYHNGFLLLSLKKSEVRSNETKKILSLGGIIAVVLTFLVMVFSVRFDLNREIWFRLKNQSEE